MIRFTVNMGWANNIGNTTYSSSNVGGGVVTSGSWRGCAPRIRKMHLDYPELSHADIARQVGCSDRNVSQVLGRFLREITNDELTQFQACKADIFDAMQFKTLASITDQDISNATYLQRITGAAILEDKARLVRGQATSINMTALVDVANMLRQQRGIDPSAIVIDGGSPEVG